jgi:hypothetical protein
MKKIAKIVAALAFIILLLSAFIFDTKNMTGEIISAIETCLYIIIPALFGFMAISSYLLRSGLYRILFRPFYLLFRHVIRLSEEEFGIFLLSLFGGYPVGAKLLTDNKSTRDMLPFCYCPSPGFVISVAGIGLFSNPRAGLAVYLSNMLACILLAALLNFKNKKHTGGNANPPLQVNQHVFTSSVLSASSALFPVCAVIVAFGVVKGALGFVGAEHELLFAALEISGVSELTPNTALLPLIAALFSTGGLCIIMQIPALAKKRIPLKGFFLWRIPAALLSALICRLIIPLFDLTVYIPASTGNIAILTEAGSPVASVCLLVMSVILVKTAGENPSTWA